MIIRRLKIQNYRGIKQAEILFPGHTLLVGNNNVGKSTICEAIDLVIGPERLSRYPVINEHDFYQSKYLDEDEQPIEIMIELVIGDLNGEQQRRFRGNLEFWNTSSNDILEAENPADTDKPEVEPIIRVTFIGKYNPDEDEFEGQTFYCHPLNPEGKQPYFKKDDKRVCGFLFLRTLRTGTRALSLEKGSLLDVILKLKDSRPKMWENVLQTLKSIDPPIDDVPELKEILTEIESRVKQYIPLSQHGSSTKFYVSNLTREHLRKTVSFFAASEPCPTLLPFNHLGTGTINTLVFSLLTCIADLKDNVIFAMEEPEIAIPPHTQRRIVQYLLKNSQQAFFTSHSPYVIEQFEPENILVLDRSDTGVITGLQAVLPDNLKPKTYQRNLRKQIAESLLGNGVLIVEGDTEADLFPIASNVLEGNADFTPIDLTGVTIINAGGEGDIAKYARFFKSIGKTTFAFFDKQTDAQNLQAIKDNVDHPSETDYSGIEKLLVALVPIDIQKQLLADTSQQPTDITDTQVREALEAALKKAKGDGLAARLISMCSPEQLPNPIAEMLTTISSVMTVTTQTEVALMQNLLLCDKRKAILSEKGHTLVLGGPGSGKTTIALLKAVECLKAGLNPEQQILFLSFSKAAVSRIMYAAGQHIPGGLKSKLLVQTYHSFCLNILKTYAPLLGVKHPLKLLAPQDEAHMRVGLNNDIWQLELEKLFYEQGRIAFSLFTPKTLLILQNSEFLETLFSEVFPIIIIDEFQDTDDQQWQLVQLLSKNSQIIALADIEQQIFDYRPEVSAQRIEQFKKLLNPSVFDLEYENNRSSGNAIQEFGFHLIRSQALKDKYEGVEIIRYKTIKNNADVKIKLKASVIKAFKAIPTSAQKKSVAVLARSDKLIAQISKILTEPIQQLQIPLKHDALIDENFSLLSARFIAFLMEPITDHMVTAADGLNILADCFKSKDNQTSIKLSQSLLGWSNSLQTGKSLRSPAIPTSLIGICRSLKQNGLSGNPLQDWTLLQSLLEQSSQKDLQEVAGASRLIKLLTNGSNLTENLNSVWRMNGCYLDARAILDQALVSEQMTTSYKPPSGLTVMNIHKSKGKEFDAVVLYEGQFSGRFTTGDVAPFLSSRKLLRVAVTRARHHVYILTPSKDPSPLFQ